MKDTPRRDLRFGLLLVLCAGWIQTGALAQVRKEQMAKEDVVDVPAIHDGLCVSNLFQTNMVLQRDEPIAIWGWADPGERVTVTLGGASASAAAGDDRRWQVTLPAQAASAEPGTLVVEAGAERLELGNVLVGDVWILGGQSNMEFELAKVENGALEIASANYDQIRILTVPYGKRAEPRMGFPRLHEWSDWFGRHFRKGDWDVCTPQVAKELSAIGYTFARRVHMASGVPIGVIDASRGGTTVESWTPRSVLDGMSSGTVKAKLADWDRKLADWDAEADLATRVERHQQRMARFEKEGRAVSQKDSVPPADLKPGPKADQNLPGACFAGMIQPLAGLSVKGAIFHQGYNNALDGMRGVRLYRDVFPVMIAEWRRAFGDDQMPFGILSQCTDGYPQTRDDYLEKMLNAGIHIRAEHYRTFLDLHEAGDRNIGFASTYDLRRRWYHPQVKVPAGERIARWALSTQYGFGRQLLWKPPALVGMSAKDGALFLELDAEVMDPEDGVIEGFAIAGEDRRFQPAEVAYVQKGEDDRGRPRLDRRRLVLTSPLVEAPVHFRYAWGRNPMGNLQVTGNKDLPFATQRSDDWDMGTVPLGVLDSKIDGAMTRKQKNEVRRALQAEDARRRAAEAAALLDAAGGDGQR